MMRFLLCLLFIGLNTLPLQAEAERRRNRNVIEVSLGGSKILNLSSTGRVTLTDPGVADVTTAGGGLLIIGRRVGETNLILHGGRQRQTWLIKVTLPSQAIEGELVRLFPRESIQAWAVGGSLVLTGTVSSIQIVEQAEQVSLGYLRSPSIAALGVKPHVINLLKVKGRHQVQLEVKFAEVNRRSLREIGVNIVGGSNDGRVAGATGSGGIGAVDVNNKAENPHSALVGRPAQLFNTNENAVGAMFLGLRDGIFPFAATLNLLASRDLSRTLAEPTLVAMSGRTASFLAGGEFPYEKSTGFGNTTVEFKKFGIELSFTPRVLNGELIELETSVGVSAPDPTVKIISDGVLTEGFKRRSSQTTVRLIDGQSFAIAGLLSDEIGNLVEKIPGLGDIPILGTLFSSKKFSRRETELVVVVTARLVDPMNANEVPPLPGWERVSDPSDIELFLLNFTDPNAPVGQAMEPGMSARNTGHNPLGRIGFWR